MASQKAESLIESLERLMAHNVSARVDVRVALRNLLQEAMPYTLRDRLRSLDRELYECTSQQAVLEAEIIDTMAVILCGEEV